MFNQKIIDFIKISSPEFEKLDIRFDGKKINSNLYDLVNYHVISANVINKSKERLAILHPHDELFNILFLIYTGLSHIKKNIVNDKKPNELKLNECVLVKDTVDNSIKRGLYGGASDDLYGGYKGTYHKLNYRTNQRKDSETVSWIYQDERRKFYPSHSTATDSPIDLQSLPGSELIEKRGHVLKSIFKDICEDKTLYKQSGILIVAEQKDVLDKFASFTVNGIELKDLFSIAYYPNPDEAQRIGRDFTEREYFIHMCTDMDIAFEVSKSNPDIKTLLICGAAKVKSGQSLLPSIITQRENIEDIYILLNTSDYELADELRKGKHPFDSWLWLSNDLKNLSNLSPIIPAEFNEKGNLSISESSELASGKLGSLRKQESGFINSSDSVIRRHNMILTNSLVTEHEAIGVSYPQGINEDSVNKLKSVLEHLSRFANKINHKELNFFVFRIYRFLYFMLSLPFPLHCIIGNEILYAFENDIKVIINELKKTNLSPDLHSHINEARALVIMISQDFNTDSPKLNKVSELIEKNKNKKICLVVCNRDRAIDYREIFRAALGLSSHDFRDITIKTHSEINETDDYDLTMFTSFTPFHENPVLLENSFGKKISLFYPCEYSDYRKFQTKSLKLLDELNRDDIRSILLGVYEENTLSGKDYLTSESQESRTLLESLKDSFRAIARSQSPECLKGEAVVEAIFGLFDGGKYALLPKGKKVKIFDRENESIKEISVMELTKGDDVIFLDDSRKEIFEELIEAAVEKGFIDKNTIELSDLWQHVLKEFVTEKRMSLEKLKIELEKSGVKRSIVTIRSWIDDDRFIGPPEDGYKALDAIAKITGNKELTSKLQSVKSACVALKSIHIKLGRCLVKKLLYPSITADTDETELFSELNEKLSEVTRYINIAKLIDISYETERVPVHETFRLL